MNVAYNLLRERWIPVRRASGAREWIAPHQIAERTDPPVALASPRPDFDGALIQFLIGLVQTTAAPQGKREWEDKFLKPPSPEALRERFETVAQAFDLDGDGPRFMQDLTLKPEEGERVPIGGLLIDRIGEENLADKNDLFAKPNRIPAIDFRAAAAALFGLQSNAPSGGSGHRTSLRGGGPLSTLVLGKDLMATVWLNVLVEAEFLSGPGNPELTAIDARFPWMARTRTSKEKEGGAATSPLDVHPAQHFWATPRRIRIDFDSLQSAPCAIHGGEDVPVVSHYVTRHSGANYKGDFRHPLTPYALLAPGEPLNPKKAKEDGLPYRDWPQFVFGGEKHEPARVVQAFYRHRRFALAGSPRLLAFGFEMDNMKPRAWHQGATPLLAIEPEVAEVLAPRLRGLVDASESVRKTLLQQIKTAIARRPQDLPGDLGPTVNAAFWSSTEAAFFEAAAALRDALTADSSPDPAGEAWLLALHTQAKRLFEVYAQARADFGAVDARRVAVAWNRLLKFTSPQDAKLRKAVGLPVEERTNPSKRPRKK